MGTWICHLRVAERLLDQFPDLDEVTFAFGSLAPDSGIPNEDWTEFDPPKEVTHFLQKRGEGEDAIHDLVFYDHYLRTITPEEDKQRYSFRLGYFFHLVCDILWAKRIVAATRNQFADLFVEDSKKAVNTVKGDWYGLDQLYVRNHPDHIFWRVIMGHPNPPSYLPFVRDQALHRQYDYIRKFYSEPDDQWFLSLPYHYLSENTMTGMVDDSVQAITVAYERLMSMESPDGLKSSTSILPRSLLSAYQQPLGN